MSEMLSNVTRNTFLRGVLSVGIGAAVESHTDDIARHKIVTVETCKKIYPLETTVSQDFHACVVKGVPGGAKIGSNKIPTGEPAPYVDAYLSAQRNEQGIELDRLAVWAIAGAFLELGDWLL